MRVGGLGRTGALERIGAQRTDLEPILASLQVLDRAQRGRREQRRRVHLPEVYPRGCLDRHREEVKGDERHVLGAVPREERVVNGFVRLPSGARELRADHALVRSIVRVAGDRRERASVGHEALGGFERPELGRDEGAHQQRLRPAVLIGIAVMGLARARR